MDLDELYEAKQRFLTKVREAFRHERAAIKDDDDFETFRYMAQDDLSLFSPWMNKQED